MHPARNEKNEDEQSSKGQGHKDAITQKPLTQNVGVHNESSVITEYNRI